MNNPETKTLAEIIEQVKRSEIEFKTMNTVASCAEYAREALPEANRTIRLLAKALEIDNDSLKHLGDFHHDSNFYIDTDDAIQQAVTKLKKAGGNQ